MPRLDDIAAHLAAVPLFSQLSAKERRRVAQSLGGQVISSYVWDAQRQPQASVGVWHGARGDGVASGSERAS